MTHEEIPSSSDDGIGETCAPEIGADGTNEVGQAWWANDPAIAAKRGEVQEWLASLESVEQDQQQIRRDENFSAIHREVSTGECRRELRDARKELDRARVRYADAIRAARAVGYSWGEIGQLVGVPRQLLHRRYRNEVD